jgi:hypothetical protein
MLLSMLVCALVDEDLSLLCPSRRVPGAVDVLSHE